MDRFDEKFEERQKQIEAKKSSEKSTAILDFPRLVAFLDLLDECALWVDEGQVAFRLR